MAPTEAWSVQQHANNPRSSQQQLFVHEFS